MSIYIGIIWVILIVVLIVIRIVCVMKHVELLRGLYPKQLQNYGSFIDFSYRSLWDDIGRNNFQTWQRRAFRVSYFLYSRYNTGSNLKVSEVVNKELLLLSKINFIIVLIIILSYIFLWLIYFIQY